MFQTRQDLICRVGMHTRQLHNAQFASSAFVAKYVITCTWLRFVTHVHVLLRRRYHVRHTTMFEHGKRLLIMTSFHITKHVYTCHYVANACKTKP